MTNKGVDNAKSDYWLEEQLQIGEDLGNDRLIVIDEIQRISD